MGRRTTLPVGSQCNGWEILGRTSYLNTTNQQLRLKCLRCGTVRSTWGSNLKQNSVRCKVCASLDASSDHRLSVGAILAYYGAYIEVFSEEDLLPSNIPLFKLVSTNIATPLLTPVRSGTPQPDEGYVAYLKVPAKYIGWYCLEDVTLSDSESNEAEALYASLVETPTTTNFTKHVRGSGQTWYEGDTEYGYIYWKDRTSWPKSLSKPSETLEATSIPTQP